MARGVIQWAWSFILCFNYISTGCLSSCAFLFGTDVKRNIIAHRTVTIVEMYHKLAIAHRLKTVMLSFTGATV